MKGKLVAAVAFAAMCGAAFSAGPANADARSACKADAEKYCASAIGDRSKVVSCLKSNQDRISDACRQAIASR
ncbi:cysteine rich repeat-containing protein [Camelimonas abortus]|uniref:Cysteine rich repeat-containing protein n=1 Tax=Camelimonas abortus TaxID=1017184 RepID=A0ABV7LAS7_9HYPH